MQVQRREENDPVNRAPPMVHNVLRCYLSIQMQIPLVIFLAWIAIALLLHAAWLARAPSGYQDANGFHFGENPEPEDEDKGLV